MQKLVVKLVDDVRGSWRFRVLALAAAWAVCLIGWFAVLSLQNVYEATARVYLDTRGALRPLLKGLAVEPDIESELNVVRQAMISGPAIEAIAREVGIDLAGVSPRDREASLASIKRRISITRDSQVSSSDGVYRIAFQSFDRQQSLSVVKKLLDSFVEGTLGNKRTGQVDAQRFLTEQIAEYEKRLSESESRLAAFKKQNVGKMPTDKGDYFNRLQIEMAALTDVSASLSMAEARRDELGRQLSGEEPYLFGFENANNTVASSPGAGDVATRIQELEKRREDLLLRFTPKHPEIVAVDRTLADLRDRQDAELKRVRAGMKATGDLSSSLKVNPVYQSVQIQAKQAAVQVAELRRDVALRGARVAELRRMVNSVPEVEAELARLNRDYEATRTQYQALFQRLDTAKLSDEADKTGTVTFKVIEPPSVPETPISAKRGVLLTGVLLAGLALGAGLAYVFNLLRPVFFDWRSLGEVVGAPVIGHVQLFGSGGTLVSERRDITRLFAGAASLLVAFLVVLIWSEKGARIVGGIGNGMGLL